METLITLVTTAAGPETRPQDRQGIVESAEHLAAALTVINDPQTSPELREELTSVVKQVTSALKTVSSPKVSPEARSMLILVVRRTSATLPLACDHRTRQELREPLLGTVADMSFAAESSESEGGSSDASETLAGGGGTPTVSKALFAGSTSNALIQDARTPPEQRDQLVKSTRQISALLRKASDPRASQEERSEATKKLDEETARMKDEQEEAASAQKRPAESLGKAAAVCTSAIFETTPEAALARGLKKLLPAEWEAEGVKDFWKADEKSDEELDVLAQLRNNEHTHGPFDVVPLITELAEVVPGDRLFGTLAGSALSCEQAAAYLEEDHDVTVGTWLSRTAE
ncbi:hypothetical protein [Streptomyces pilosus]|uniref:hypothetical protein n=1 Tax=Streptomyces pilosus TaxID=28893 RepID=UPI0016762FCA|nr:hypothetical protein [Streptomyces pilosus]